jgi:hypothetical protein
MSLQANFSEFGRLALQIYQGEIPPKERSEAAKIVDAYETKILTDPDFNEAMGKSVTTFFKENPQAEITNFPPSVQILAKRCTSAYSRRLSLNASLSKALNQLEKKPARVRHRYKIGLEKNDEFTLYRKGIEADCARMFQKTEFVMLSHLFEQYKQSKSADVTSYMGRIRTELLVQIQQENTIV